MIPSVRRAWPALVAILVVPALAAAQAPAATGTITAKCGDGSFSMSPTKRGACSGHGGIAEWMGDRKPAAPAAKPAAAPVATRPAPAAAPAPRASAPAAAPARVTAKPAGATGQCGDGTFTTAGSKRGACSGHGGIATWYADVATAPAPAAKPAAAPAPRAPSPVAAAPRTAPATAPARSGGIPTGAVAGAPPEATAQCNDGTFSQSQSRSGTCSRHGGVRQWLKALPPR